MVKGRMFSLELKREIVRNYILTNPNCALIWI